MAMCMYWHTRVPMRPSWLKRIITSSASSTSTVMMPLSCARMAWLSMLLARLVLIPAANGLVADRMIRCGGLNPFALVTPMRTMPLMPRLNGLSLPTTPLTVWAVTPQLAVDRQRLTRRSTSSLPARQAARTSNTLRCSAMPHRLLGLHGA